MTGKRTFGKNTRNFVNDEYTLVNHPPGNETGVSLVRVYVCGFEFSYLFSYFLLARELFGKTPSPAREARPETLVKVSARSVPSGARGRCSFFFFPRLEWVRRFPRVQREMPSSYIPTPTGKKSSQLLALSRANISPDMYYQLDNNRRQAENTTLQRCSAQAPTDNTVRVRLTHLRCTAAATCVCRSPRSHLLPLSPAAAILADPRTLWTEMLGPFG